MLYRGLVYTNPDWMRNAHEHCLRLLELQLELEAVTNTMAAMPSKTRRETNVGLDFQF